MAWVKVARNARFRGGLVFKAYRLCVSLNSRLDSNKKEEERQRVMVERSGRRATVEFQVLVVCQPAAFGVWSLEFGGLGVRDLGLGFGLLGEGGVIDIPQRNWCVIFAIC